jgi:hypothetical protein
LLPIRYDEQAGGGPVGQFIGPLESAQYYGDVFQMPGPFTLTWTGTEIDEEVYSFEVSQQEAEAASLKIVIVNPRYPLLSGELWATLAYNNGTSTVTLFYGRLVGIPSDLQNEFVNLEFIAKPDNFEDQKAAVS